MTNKEVENIKKIRTEYIRNVREELLKIKANLKDDKSKRNVRTAVTLLCTITLPIAVYSEGIKSPDSIIALAFVTLNATALYFNQKKIYISRNNYMTLKKNYNNQKTINMKH